MEQGQGEGGGRTAGVLQGERLDWNWVGEGIPVSEPFPGHPSYKKQTIQISDPLELLLHHFDLLAKHVVLVEFLRFL